MYVRCIRMDGFSLSLSVFFFCPVLVVCIFFTSFCFCCCSLFSSSICSSFLLARSLHSLCHNIQHNPHFPYPAIMLSLVSVFNLILFFSSALFLWISLHLMPMLTFKTSSIPPLLLLLYLEFASIFFSSRTVCSAISGLRP